MKKLVNGVEMPIGSSNAPNPMDDIRSRMMSSGHGQPPPNAIPINIPPPSQNSSYPIEKSKYEVKKDSYFTIRFGLLETDERFLIVPENKFGLSEDIEKHWVKFRYWTYVEELKWRESSTKFDPSSRSFTVDRGKFDELKIRHLLVDWSFGEISDRHRLFHSNGYLVDECFEMFKSLFPNIVNTIISYMNDILEYNQ